MDLVKKIIDKNLPVVFVSPHFDDAVLSCGMLLLQLGGKVDMTIINVFTTAHGGPYTLSAKQFLKASGGYTNAKLLYEARAKEDQNALSRLPVSVVNLHLEDALFRRKKQRSFLGKMFPEFDAVYPTYRWHVIKKISRKDDAVTALREQLKKNVQKDAIVFAPCGIGNHVDHQIVHKVCRSLFAHLVLYSDFPYNVRLHDYGRVKKHQHMYRLNQQFDKKLKLIRVYKSQLQGLFPEGKIPQHEEVYFSTYL